LILTLACQLLLAVDVDFFIYKRTMKNVYVKDELIHSGSMIPPDQKALEILKNLKLNNALIIPKGSINKINNKDWDYNLDEFSINELLKKHEIKNNNIRDIRTHTREDITKIIKDENNNWIAEKTIQEEGVGRWGADSHHYVINEQIEKIVGLMYWESFQSTESLSQEYKNMMLEKCLKEISTIWYHIKHKDNSLMQRDATYFDEILKGNIQTKNEALLSLRDVIKYFVNYQEDPNPEIWGKYITALNKIQENFLN